MKLKESNYNPLTGWTPMYEITDYDERYRPYDKSGGELKSPEWVKVPALPKGDGLQALLEHPRGLEIFGIWILLLEKTTAEKKPENRGKLLNHKEESASIPEIAKGISLPTKARLVEKAINTLVSIGWVKSEQPSAELPQTSAKSSVLKSSVEKSKYGDFVLLTSAEYQKLIQQFGEKTAKAKIQELDDAIGSKGYRYKSHYRTILVWHRRQEKEKSDKDKAKACRRRCTVCGKPGVKYKVVAGEEIWRCPKHPHDLPKSKAPQLYDPKGVPPARDKQALKVAGLKKAEEM